MDDDAMKEPEALVERVCTMHGPLTTNTCLRCELGDTTLVADASHDYRGSNPITGELAEWWRALSEKEIAQTIAKAQEYGGDDLAYMGAILQDAIRGPEVIREETSRAAETAVAFYALGKITRIIGALKEGRKPSDDSWLDLHVYAGMAIRIRETGGWPNG
jgi:hypothetical protein